VSELRNLRSRRKTGERGRGGRDPREGESGDRKNGVWERFLSLYPYHIYAYNTG